MPCFVVFFLILFHNAKAALPFVTDDAAPLINKNIRLIAESYNGAPNSPRDSDGYFNSYQMGIKFIKNDSLSFHILYGTQPTFAGYNIGYNSLYRQTQWIQLGVRKVLN